MAVFQGIFLGGTLIFKNKNRLRAQFFLGLAILGVSIRVGKSLVYYFWPNMSLWGVALGGAGLWCIGPALFFSLRSLLNKETTRASVLIHFLPAGLILLSPLVLGWPGMTYVYGFGIVHLMIYFVLTIQAYYRGNRNTVNLVFLLAVAIIALTFIFQFFTDTLESYAIGGILAAVCLYAINFLIISEFKNSNQKFNQNGKQLNKAQLQSVSNSIHEIFRKEEVYKEPKLTLNKLAGRISEPTYLVRHAINQLEGKNFNDFVNSYRVEAVKTLLEEDKLHYTVEGMAFEVGFSSTSSFYAAFKKITKCTPIDYKKRLRSKV